MTTSVIRIVIAEDHTLVRQGMLLVLSRDSRLHVVADAADGESAWRATREFRPDILLLDLGLPGLAGLDLMEMLTAHELDTRVLIVTARQDAASLQAALARGAHGYVLKTDDDTALVEAVHVVAAGGYYVSRELALASGGAEPAMLTPREIEIARAVGRGLSSKQIGAALDISEHTVRKHRENIGRKLELRNAAELVAWAVRHGL
jgi:DNA-binding NarL/FixJ family response regulator